MDFSTIDRALTSLSRRQPPLPEPVLAVSQSLLALLSTNNETHNHLAESREYAHGILKLIELGSSKAGSGDESSAVRWEPLAVGLRLTVDYLEKRTSELPTSTSTASNNQDDDDEDEGTGLGTGGGGVYAEGPRIPKIADLQINGTSSSSASVSEKVSSPPKANSPVFELLLALPEIINNDVEHSEPRVRSLVAQTVGAYALYSTSLLNYQRDIIINNDQDEDPQLKQTIQTAQQGRASIHNAILSSLQSHLQMREPSRDNNPSKASDGALDDTTGWRALETNLHALASFIDGCVGKGVVEFDGEDEGGSNVSYSGSYMLEEERLFSNEDEENRWFLTGLQHCCVLHVNRHVRAASAAVLGVLVKSCMRCRSSHGKDGNYHENLLVEDDSPFRLTLKESLRATLQDNWSQVRMAGSVLCRRFVTALLKIYISHNHNGEEEDEELTIFELAAGDLVQMLLPRMCLNRFYLAQGVKLYSQDTWKIIFGSSHNAAEGEEGLHSSGKSKGGGGMGAVARNAAPLCRYYSKMCDADNHAVREVCFYCLVYCHCVVDSPCRTQRALWSS